MKWYVDKQLYMKIRLENSDITIGPDSICGGDLFVLKEGREFIDDGKCIQVLKCEGERLLRTKREEAKTYLQIQKDMRKKLSDACKETTGKSYGTVTMGGGTTWKEIIKNFFKG